MLARLFGAKELPKKKKPEEKAVPPFDFMNLPTDIQNSILSLFLCDLQYIDPAFFYNFAYVSKYFNDLIAQVLALNLDQLTKCYAVQFNEKELICAGEKMGRDFIVPSQQEFSQQLIKAANNQKEEKRRLISYSKVTDALQEVKNKVQVKNSLVGDCDWSYPILFEGYCLPVLSHQNFGSSFVLPYAHFFFFHVSGLMLDKQHCLIRPAPVFGEQPDVSVQCMRVGLFAPKNSLVQRARQKYEEAQAQPKHATVSPTKNLVLTG